MKKTFLEKYKNFLLIAAIVVLLNASLVLASFNLGDSNHQINLGNDIVGNNKQIINISGLAVGTTTLTYQLNSVGNMYVSGTLYTQNIEGNIEGGGGSSGPISATNVSAGQFGANTGGGSYVFPNNLTAGQNNTALGQYSAVIGGKNSTSSGDFSGIFASLNSQTNSSYSAIIGGRHNTLNGLNSVIINSSSSIIQTYATNSAIIGGEENNIYGENSIIAGGISNTISTSTQNSVTINGTYNTLKGNYSAILSSFSSQISDSNYSLIINSDEVTNQADYSISINQTSSTNSAYRGILLNGNNVILTSKATSTIVFNSFNNSSYTIDTPYAFLVDPNQTGTKIGIGTGNPTENLDINGAIKIGDTSEKKSGSLKWTGTNFQGCTNQWEYLGISKGTIAWFDSEQNRNGWTYLYTEYINAWQRKASMPTARYNLAIGVANNKIYAIGGSGGLTKNEEYDPSTNTWTTKADMPTGRWGLAAGVVNNKIYAIGGYDGSNYLSTNEEYDPSTNTWTTKADMPSPRRLLAVGVANNKIYAIGGYKGSATSTNEEYDPSTNTWTTKASMITGRRYLSVGTTNNKIYAIGGYLVQGYSGIATSTNEELDLHYPLYVYKKD